jgi:hypothetical protein
MEASTEFAAATSTIESHQKVAFTELAAVASALVAQQENVINQSSPQRMYTEVVLQREGEAAGKLDAVTRTWTGILARGFTGGVYVLLRHESRAIIGLSGLHSFGVDGRWIGRSDRTDYWSEYFDPRVAAATVELQIIQLHTPKDRLPAILAEIEQKVQLAKETAKRLGLG